jgi:hypothetical protein
MHYGLVAPHKRLHRKPVNPYDRATVISVYPRDVIEDKPTVFPGRFKIAAGSPENPVLTVIEPTSWFREVDENMAPIEVQVNAFELARSIVADYCGGFPKFVPEVSQPGLFFIPGKFDSVSIQSYVDESGAFYRNLLAKAISMQRSWFAELVKMADIDWSRTTGNPLSISELSKMAAKELGQTSKPWLQDFMAISLLPCPSCGTMGNPSFPKCGNCGYIVNQTRAIELGLIPPAAPPYVEVRTSDIMDLGKK